MEHTGPPISLKASGRTRRRLLVNRGTEGIATVAAFGAVAVLAVVTVSVVVRAVPALKLSLFTQGQPPFGTGIENAIIGSAILVALAAAMAVPVGVLIAIFVSEFASTKIGRPIRLALDVLNGVPSIVIGIFVFGLLVVGNGQSGWAGSFGLAVIMLPLVARTTMEVLALVPAALREASFALGVSKWRTVVFVVLPTALGGILTGATLAVARAAGETAPILFTSSIFSTQVQTDPSQAVPNLPFVIFSYSEQPDPTLHQQAWAAALLLMGFVLVSSLAARALLARSERKLRG
jgi:phosphate transport system permease protein